MTCAMCSYPRAEYSGGFEYKDQKIEDKFCSKNCFDLWCKWKYAFLEFLSR